MAEQHAEIGDGGAGDDLAAGLIEGKGRRGFAHFGLADAVPGLAAVENRPGHAENGVEILDGIGIVEPVRREILRRDRRLVQLRAEGPHGIVGPAVFFRDVSLRQKAGPRLGHPLAGPVDAGAVGCDPGILPRGHTDGLGDRKRPFGGGRRQDGPNGGRQDHRQQKESGKNAAETIHAAASSFGKSVEADEKQRYSSLNRFWPRENQAKRCRAQRRRNLARSSGIRRKGMMGRNSVYKLSGMGIEGKGL